MRILMMIMVLSLGLGACASSHLPYFISIGPPSDSNTRADGSSKCAANTVPLDQVVKQAIEETLNKRNTLDIRTLQFNFERALDEQVKGCGANKSLPEASRSKKWLSVYAFGSADPDQDLERFEEYLQSMQLLQKLLTSSDRGLLADKAEERTDTGWLGERREDNSSSQWCGNPTSKTDCAKAKRHLYMICTTATRSDTTRCQPNEQSNEKLELVAHLLDRINRVKTERDRYTRFIVLGYEIPWDKDGIGARIRYGVTFYFEDKVYLADEKPKSPETQYAGYALLYANEATPEPFPPTQKVKGATNGPQDGDHKQQLWRYVWYGTGWPFAVAIGLKNAAFELTKAPFSVIAGALFGEGLAYDYPRQNLLTAGDAIRVEVTNWPSYGAFGGLYNLLTETPLVGQLAAINTGPEHLDMDTPHDSSDVRQRVFLSRGIYGGDKWGQDTGLWALLAHHAYPTYHVYSPPYRHGTVTDVVWSMFNLSHGPGYSEARYVMDYASLNDHLYLAGHSGGVQRSAAASRILANHGYSVVKVMGIAGPSIGQAYVDTRYPNAFRIFLNTEAGANQDVTSKVGVTANFFTTILDWTVLGVPKYAVGGLAGLFSDVRKQEVYTFVDHLGYANATVTQVDRKPSTRHHTPLRESLAEPIVFDAYVRSEFASAFREDLERPDSSDLPCWIIWLKDPWSPRASCMKFFQDPESRKRDNAFHWSR